MLFQPISLNNLNLRDLLWKTAKFVLLKFSQNIDLTQQTVCILTQPKYSAYSEFGESLDWIGEKSPKKIMTLKSFLVQCTLDMETIRFNSRRSYGFFPNYSALWRQKREGKESAWVSWEGAYKIHHQLASLFSIESINWIQQLNSWFGCRICLCGVHFDHDLLLVLHMGHQRRFYRPYLRPVCSTLPNILPQFEWNASLRTFHSQCNHHTLQKQQTSWTQCKSKFDRLRVN